MMAKMFYTLDEAKVALGKNEEEIKQLAREGKLREFRDGPRLMFKADQIEQLKGDLGSGGSRLGDQVDLGPSDSGVIGMVDSKGASGTSLTLNDSDGGRSPGAGMTLKDDTALAADLGLSGSLGGVPSPRGPGSGSGTGLSGMGTGSSGSRGGIDVFQPGEVDRVDPAAQTAINPAVSDQLNLEGVGSGSGLLDLTRESDDTSLGAELLDEIAPSSGKKRPTKIGAAGDSVTGSGLEVESLEELRPVGRSFGAPMMVEAPDATAPAFGAMALAAAFVCLFGAFVVTAAVMGTQPAIVMDLAIKGLWICLGIGLGAAILFFVIGLFIGKAAR